MLTCLLQGIGSNHPTKYNQDTARRGRVEGLLRAPQAATIRHILRREENWSLENLEKNP